MKFFFDLLIQAEKDFREAKDIFSLNLIYSKFLGKNGYLKFKELKIKFGLLKNDKMFGLYFNKTKRKIKNLFELRKIELERKILKNKLESKKIDISLPGRNVESGNFHPITKLIDCIEQYFVRIGFSIEFGPEIEDCYYNFKALNTPSNHPAWSLHDTFWLNKKYLLRTQTSSVQIRVMKNKKLPIRIITSGRVYRRDYDKTHTPMFHQTEGLVIDKNVSFSNLKCIIFNFLNFLFKKRIPIRFRPSYFPFTEPSAEVDIMDKNGKWIEILGCGMVHPNVMNNIGINSNLYSGFAFGIGIERLAMLLFNIKDLRIFFENDIRFLKQFI